MSEKDLPTSLTEDADEDYSQILPIQQKRTIAFVNHFIMSFVSYLNHFAESCESRFIEFEYKMQKIEAALLIIESQLSSIKVPKEKQAQYTTNSSNNYTTSISDISNTLQDKNEGKNEVEINETKMEEVQPALTEGIKAKDDERFLKFFKMLRVGVPEQAVKSKMKSEGIDPNILDTPDVVIPE